MVTYAEPVGAKKKNFFFSTFSFSQANLTLSQL